MPRPAWLETFLQLAFVRRQPDAAWLDQGSAVRKVGSPDLHQAKMRFLVLVGCVAYGLSVGVFGEGLTSSQALIFGLDAVLFGLFALHTYFHFKRNPEPDGLRRTAGLFADHAAALGCLAVTGRDAGALAWLPLFIIQGVGIRFGVRWLYASQAIGVASVGVICAVNPFFRDNSTVGWGAILSVLVLPLYFALLARREARIKAKLEEARLEAEEANAAKGRFVAMISHELRTPLTGISGLNELLRQQDLPTHTHQLLVEQSAATSLMLTMVNDVLDLSKVEAGRMQVQEVDFDPQQIALSVLQALSFQARSKGLAVHVELDASLPAVVRGSPFHLSRILQNILGNAIKFTLEGSITLRVTCDDGTPSVDGTSSIRFEVVDTGIGIPASALPKIFDRFYQVDAAITRRFGGTGLGTSLVKEFVDLLEGTVRLESRLGEGTRCLVSLPFKSEAADGDAAVTDLAGAAVAVAAQCMARWPTVETLLLEAGASVRRLDTARHGAEAVADGVGPTTVLVLGDGPSQDAMTAIATMDLTDRAIVLLGDTTRSAAPRSGESSHLVVRARSDLFVTRAVQLARLGARSGLQHDAVGIAMQSRLPAPDALRVLVAEDTPTVQLVMRVTLENAGFAVTVTDDGVDALHEAMDRPFDVIVLDWNMPRLDGIGVVRRLRSAAGPNALTPIVIATAAPSQQLVEHAVTAGARSVLSKPFQGQDLVRAIEGAVGAGRETKAVSATSAVASAESRHQPPLLDVEALEGPDSIFRAVDRDKLMGAFTRDVERTKPVLLEAVATADAALFRASIHSLSGYAGTLGARRLQWQLANSPQDTDDLIARGPTAVAELCETMDVTSRALDEWSRAFFCPVH